MGPQFHETQIGQTFLKGTMPALVRELKQLNKNMEMQVLPPTPSNLLEDKKKLGCILAGLRMLQREIREYGGAHLPLGILDILKDNTNVLDDPTTFCKFIDELYEELNV